MRFASLMAGAVLALGMAAAVPTASHAAPLLPNISTGDTLVEQAGWRHDGWRRHHRWGHDGWRHHRWGHDGWRRHHRWGHYGWRHHRWGGGYGSCRAWRHECADRWGWGTWDYRRCMHRHGC